jgi:hypothetical protein
MSRAMFSDAWTIYSFRTFYERVIDMARKVPPVATPATQGHGLLPLSALLSQKHASVLRSRCDPRRNNRDQDSDHRFEPHMRSSPRRL